MFVDSIDSIDLSNGEFLFSIGRMQLSIRLLHQSRSQSFVPLDQRSENESSGSIHFEITMGNNRILVIRFTAQSQSTSISCYGACLKWLLPELSFSDRWSRGTKLWERDCCCISLAGLRKISRLGKISP